jgi:anti-sigma B factor antagonist
MTDSPAERPIRECVKAVRWFNRTAVVDMQGDVDLSRSSEFQQSLLGVMDQRPERIVVNLAEVPYMDSSGVASLVKLLSRARRQQVGLRLAGLTDRVRSIFEITRLDGIFDIHATVEEALA